MNLVGPPVFSQTGNLLPTLSSEWEINLSLDTSFDISDRFAMTQESEEMHPISPRLLTASARDHSRPEYTICVRQAGRQVMQMRYFQTGSVDLENSHAE